MKKLQILGALLLLCSMAFAQKPTTECVTFRKGFDQFPIPGKGTITMLDGTKIEGEFRQGATVLMNKWQWHDTKGQLHKIKAKEVARVDFEPDMKFVDKDIEININLSIGGKDASAVTQKNLPFNIKQFENFDQKKYYTPVIIERVVTKVNRKGKESAKLMVLVNNGFDSKYKVYVDFGAKMSSFGRSFSVWDLFFGGTEMGDFYTAFRTVKTGENESQLIKKPGLIKFWLGGFRNKEFVELFGDNAAFMECYPKSMKRKFRYTPEFFWVYDQK